MACDRVNQVYMNNDVVVLKSSLDFKAKMLISFHFWALVSGRAGSIMSHDVWE